MNVEISKDMEYCLYDADFDVEEVKLVVPELFPNAKSIKVTDCEDNWLEVLVDEKYYAVNAIGDIRDGTLFECRKMDKHYWIALYTDGTYDELCNTKEGAIQWIKERGTKQLQRLVLDE